MLAQKYQNFSPVLRKLVTWVNRTQMGMNKVLPQLINAFRTPCFIKLLSFLTMLATGKTQTSIFSLALPLTYILSSHISLSYETIYDFKRLTCFLWTSHWHSMDFTPASVKEQVGWLPHRTWQSFQWSHHRAQYWCESQTIRKVEV